MNEANFILKLINDGVNGQNLELIRKFFFENGRLNLNSPTVQSLLLRGELNETNLVEATKAIIARRKEDCKNC